MKELAKSILFQTEYKPTSSPGEVIHAYNRTMKHIGRYAWVVESTPELKASIKKLLDAE